MKIFLERRATRLLLHLTNQQKLELEQFMLAFPTDLAPIVGQQVTLTATNGGGGRTRASIC